MYKHKSSIQNDICQNELERWTFYQNINYMVPKSTSNNDISESWKYLMSTYSKKQFYAEHADELKRPMLSYDQWNNFVLTSMFLETIM